MRFRITIRNTDVELRGYIDVDDLGGLYGFSAAMDGVGTVVASPAAEDYNPFTRWESDTERDLAWESSHDIE
jgi:hypothetical protein